jgi:hypothetical protein
LTLSALPPEARAAVEAALLPGEAVRWLGLPDPAKSPGNTGAGFTLAYVWLGIAGLWEAGALTAAIASGLIEAWYYVAVGAVFIGIGLLFLVRAASEQRAARRRIHLVTDQRLLTLDLADPAKSLTIRPAEIGYAEPVTRPGGHGDIEIGHGAAGVTAKEASAFHHLRGVGDVNGAIKALRRLVNDQGGSLVTEAPDD